jgi:putative redox protein
MEAIVKVVDGVKFSAVSRGHEVLSDQPVESGGTDGAMTPPELLLASLGTCAAYYAVQYLKIQKLSSEGLVVKVEAEKEKNPARMHLFRILVDHPAAAEAKHQQGLHRAAEKCLIHATLLNTPAIQITVAAPVPAALPSECENCSVAGN